MREEQLSLPEILETPPSSYVRASNGDLLPIRAWLPARPRRVVVALHGMVTHSGWFSRLGKLLFDQGVALIAPDRRGNGRAKDLGQAGNIDMLIADVHAVVELARASSDDVTLFSWCGSANYAIPASAQVAISRLVLASPGLVPLPEMSARFRNAQAVDGFLPIHFDPARDFTDLPEIQRIIRADKLYLRRIPLELRGAWKALNPLAKKTLGTLSIPHRCILTRTDRMIDIHQTASLMPAVDWVDGGHGFVLEPIGSRAVATILGAK